MWLRQLHERTRWELIDTVQHLHAMLRVIGFKTIIMVDIKSVSFSYKKNTSPICRTVATKHYILESLRPMPKHPSKWSWIALYRHEISPACRLVRTRTQHPLSNQNELRGLQRRYVSGKTTPLEGMAMVEEACAHHSRQVHAPSNSM